MTEVIKKQTLVSFKYTKQDLRSPPPPATLLRTATRRRRCSRHVIHVLAHLLLVYEPGQANSAVPLEKEMLK